MRFLHSLEKCRCEKMRIIKVIGVDTTSLKSGDIFVVRGTSHTFFLRKIEVKKLRNEDEINEIMRYAHENMEKSFWMGVKLTLLWIMGLIERKEIKEE